MIFEVVKPIRVKSRGRIFRPGETLEVDPQKAKRYIDLGALRPVDQPGDKLEPGSVEVVPTPETPETEKTDPVTDFRRKNIAVRIRSAVLGEDVWLVSNESVREHLKSEGLVCYLAEEIELMKNLSPEAVKKIHLVKKQFGGSTRIVTPERSERKRHDHRSKGN